VVYSRCQLCVVFLPSGCCYRRHPDVSFVSLSYHFAN
jgi:hypothetical protein